jgi:hypothetical protein
MEKKFNVAKYFWQIVYAHTIAYFIAGLFGLYVMNYKELFAQEMLSALMRPVDEPIVALGPLLQIIRGIIMAIILVPLRKTIFEEKNGFLKLGLIITWFSFLSTIGPTMGSFEGFIYTKVSYKYQLLGYPEAILYVLLFIGIIYISKKYENKKITTVLSIILMALVSLMCIMGFVMA